MDKQRKSCTCSTCQAACMEKPGWFIPGEAEEVAKYLDMTLQELFDTYLAVDWFVDNDNDNDNVKSFILSPITKDIKPGTYFPFFPAGECIFFRDKRCMIHPVAPKECRDFVHGQTFTEAMANHKAIAHSWKDDEGQLESLLGDKLSLPIPTIKDKFKLIAHALKKHIED